MKRLNYSLFILVALISSNLFFSCNSRKIGFFHNTYPTYASKEKSATEAAAADHSAGMPVEQKQEEAIYADAGNNPEIAGPARPESIQNLPEIDPSKKITREQKKEIRKFIKENLKKSKAGESDVNVLLLVIIAILLPPVAVLIVDGLSGPFWLSILLTLLFYLPGLIYALYRIFRQ